MHVPTCPYFAAQQHELFVQKVIMYDKVFVVSPFVQDDVILHSDAFLIMCSGSLLDVLEVRT